MVALTMMALALSEDSIRLRARRNEVINALGMLPEHIREVGSNSTAALLCSPLRLSVAAIFIFCAAGSQVYSTSLAITGVCQPAGAEAGRSDA